MVAEKSLCGGVVLCLIVSISSLSGDVMNMEEEIVRVHCGVVVLLVAKERVHDAVSETTISSI